MKGWSRPATISAPLIAPSAKRDARGHKQHGQHAEFRRNLRRSRHGRERAADEAEQRRNADAAPRIQHDLVSPASVHVAPARKAVKHEPSQEPDPESRGDRQRRARP